MIVAAALSALLLAQGAAPVGTVATLEVIAPAPILRTQATTDLPDSAENANSDRVACREETKPNSRFSRRVCRKAKDWNRTSLAAQGGIQSVQNRTIANDERSVLNGN